MLLYEIHDINRFESVQDFASYCRLVRCSHESAGKKKGNGGAKIGNAHLNWAFSEAAVSFLRHNAPGKKLVEKLAKKHGKGKALSVLAHKLARAIYYIVEEQHAVQPGAIYGNGVELEGTGAARGPTRADTSEHALRPAIKQCAIASATRSLCRYSGNLYSWIGAPSRSVHR